MRSAFLAVVTASLVLAMGCGNGIDDKPDGGPVVDAGTLEGGFVVRTEQAFVELEDAASLEIISGFQGGWHVEPYLSLSNIEAEALNGSATFWVEQNGTQVADAGQIEFEPIFFQTDGEAYLFFTQIQFLTAGSADEVVGEAVVRGEVILDDGRTVEVMNSVNLVNEVEEFEF